MNEQWEEENENNTQENGGNLPNHSGTPRNQERKGIFLLSGSRVEGKRQMEAEEI